MSIKSDGREPRWSTTARMLPIHHPQDGPNREGDRNQSCDNPLRSELTCLLGKILRGHRSCTPETHEIIYIHFGFLSNASNASAANPRTPRQATTINRLAPSATSMQPLAKPTAVDSSSGCSCTIMPPE